MLLQTVKSRNLWLWGEIVQPTSTLRYRDQLLAEQENLENEKSILSDNLVYLNKQNQGQSEGALALQENLKSVQEDLNKIQEKIDNFNDIKDVNSADYEGKSIFSIYTNPFKITALQSIDVTWDNPIGESYGISSNFLQSWHNKPVSISFKGISYMGAFGGDTVGNLSDNANDGVNEIANKVNSAVSSVTGAVSNFISNVQEGAQQKISGIDVEGKFGPVVDEDIKKINQLLSKYGEGLFTENTENKSPYVYLLMENSGSANKDSFVTFIGHIKNFTYSERADKPFLYDYTVQFVGEPVITATAAKAKINAKADSNSVKLTVVASDSGYSLGYGW